MPEIHLTTFIAAPVERVFNLSRSIDLQKLAMSSFEGKPLDGGMIGGLINNGDTVIWSAKHLFKLRRLKTKVTQLEKLQLFIAEQVEGDFKLLKHEHYFKSIQNGTILIDKCYFETPYGIFGKWLNKLFLTKYMEKLLIMRNDTIKKVAESNQWNQFLN